LQAKILCAPLQQGHGFENLVSAIMALFTVIFDPFFLVFDPFNRMLLLPISKFLSRDLDASMAIQRLAKKASRPVLVGISVFF